MCVTAGVEAAAVACGAGELDAVDGDPPVLAPDVPDALAPARARARRADALAPDAGADVVDVGSRGARQRHRVRGRRAVAPGSGGVADGQGQVAPPTAGASPEATLSGSEASPIR